MKLSMMNLTSILLCGSFFFTGSDVNLFNFVEMRICGPGMKGASMSKSKYNDGWRAGEMPMWKKEKVCERR